MSLQNEIPTANVNDLMYDQCGTRSLGYAAKPRRPLPRSRSTHTNDLSEDLHRLPPIIPKMKWAGTLTDRLPIARKVQKTRRNALTCDPRLEGD